MGGLRPRGGRDGRAIQLPKPTPLTPLDGFGNVTAALRAAGSDWVHIVVSDNGGPLDHSSNYPLRAGKASNFE
eukprot:gene11949-biopygen5974